MNNLPDDKNRRVLIIDDTAPSTMIFEDSVPAASTVVALEAEESGGVQASAEAVQHTRFELDSAYQDRRACCW